MNKQLSAIQRQRAALVARAAQQRQDVNEIFSAWSGPISLLDRAVALFKRLRASPLVIPVVAVALLWLQRQRRWKWLGHAGTAWQVASLFLDGFLSRPGGTTSSSGRR